MRRALLPATALALSGLLVTPSTAQAAAAAQVAQVAPTSPASVSADLRYRLHAAIAGSTAGTVSVAVDVVGLGAVFRQAATTAVPPASTEKLLTTFAALQALGPGARLRTQLLATYPQRGPYLPGNLYLVGGGDPFLSAGQLDALAAAVRAAGIRKVEGSLVVDDLRYDAVRRAPGWKASYVPDESGPLSALALDRNTWRRDSSYLSDPGIPTLGRLREMLSRHGVSVSPALHRGAAPAGARVVASHVSASLTDLVRRTDKESDNFAAELLLKELGRSVRGTGSSAAGVAAVRDVLAPLGVGVGSMSDGSGLSSRDRQSAAGELSLLSAAEGSGVYDALRRALPVACTDGTLKDRMCNTAAAGTALAKTGTLPGTHALTGWTTTADGHLVRYAILLTGTTSTTRARAAIDACVALLSAAHADA